MKYLVNLCSVPKGENTAKCKNRILKCNGYISYIVLGWALLMSTGVAASNAAEQLTHYLSGMHSLQAAFTQTVNDGSGQVLQQSAGTMALLRPGRLRWMTQQPTRQLLMIDHQRLWIHEVDLKQVTIDKLATTQHDLPAFLLSDEPSLLAQQFTITQRSPDHFYLLPKLKDSTFSHIHLYFSQRTLQRIALSDRLGQTTVIAFSHVLQNQPVDAAQFNFVMPKGVDVIDNSE